MISCENYAPSPFYMLKPTYDKRKNTRSISLSRIDCVGLLRFLPYARRQMGQVKYVSLDNMAWHGLHRPCLHFNTTLLDVSLKQMGHRMYLSFKAW